MKSEAARSSARLHWQLRHAQRGIGGYQLPLAPSPDELPPESYDPPLLPESYDELLP